MEDFLLDNLVVWLRTRGASAWDDDFEAMLLQQSGAQGVVSSQYGKHQIRRMVVADATISMVVLGKTLALSANESHLRRCIDVYDGARPSFAESGASWPQQQGQPWRQFFVHMVALAEVFGIEQSSKSLIQPIDTIAYREFLDQGTAHKHLRIAYDPQRVDPAVAKVLLGTPGSVPPSMPMAKDSMLWLWSNSLPFSLFFPLNEEADVNSINSDVHEGSEILKEVVSEITDHLERASLVVADTNPSNSPLAIPLMVLCTRIEEPQHLLARLGQLSNFYQVSLGVVDQEPLRYWYWTQSPGEGFTFLFGVYEGLFFLSNSREVVHRLFGVSKDAKLSQEPRATTPVEPSLTHYNNLLAYINNKEFFATVQKLTQVVATLTAIKDRRLAAHYWALSDGLLRPLLEGWQQKNRRSLVGATVTAGKIEVEVISRPESQR
jgi:hypothetical protein